MDNSNFWDWDNEEEHRVSSVYRDTADETQNDAKRTDIEDSTEVHTIETQNNFILVDHPQEPTQNTNPQSDVLPAQTQQQETQQQETQQRQTGYQQNNVQQTEYQRTGYQQNDFQQMIPIQNTQQNQDTNRQKAKQNFNPNDISENKVSAMAAYLLGPVGIIIALLIARDSAYTAFHVRQALKITVCSVVLEIIAAILALFGMIPFVGIIFKLVLVIIAAIWLGVLVLRLVAIVQVCDGEAREPAIIGKMNCFH